MPRPPQEADINSAEVLIAAGNPSDKVVAALVYRGLDPAVAQQVVDNIRAGKKGNFGGGLALGAKAKPRVSKLAVVSACCGLLILVLIPIDYMYACVRGAHVIPLAIVALVCGHRAKRKIREDPENLKRKDLAIFGMVVGYLVVAGIALLSVTAVENFVRARRQAETQRCNRNLMAIDGAKQIWQLEHLTETNAPTWEQLQPYFDEAGAPLPRCPAGGTYSINAVREDATCSMKRHQMGKRTIEDVRRSPPGGKGGGQGGNAREQKKSPDGPGK